MKFESPLVILLAAICCIASNPSVFAQFAAFESGEHQLVSPSTVCVIKLSAEAIANPSGLFETADFAPFVASMQEYSKGQDLIITFGAPEIRLSSPARVYVARQGRSAEEATVAMKQHGFGPVQISGEYLSMPLFLETGPPATQAKWEHDPKRFAEFDAAMKAVDGQAVQIVFLPPKYIWRTYREMQVKLPEEMGGGPSSLLTDGVVWAAAGINPADLSMTARIQSASEQAASDLAAILPTWISYWGNSLPGGPSEGLSQLLRISETQLGAERSTVVASVSAIKGDGPEVVKNLVQRVVAPVSMRRKSNQLKQLLLAIHNYESAYKYLPPGPKARDEDGKPWLSWRVHVLPFLGKEGVALWEEFHLDEPWDSEHNMTLLERMPAVFAVPNGVLASQQTRPGYTTFQAPFADNTIMGFGKAIKFSDLTDGTSNTIAIVEVKPENAVPWTAPQDYEFDAANPGAGLFVQADGTFNCAFADGSTHRAPADLSPEILLALFGMNDGKVARLP